MNIVHISNDFLYQKLYPNLVEEFANQNIEQRIYIQCRDSSEIDAFKTSKASVFASHIYRFWMKFFYGFRIKVIAKDFLERNIVDAKSIIFSHFLITDGGVALEVKKQKGTKYIVAVRNSDINHYLKMRPWLKEKAKEIVLNAEKIIFLSPTYKSRLKEILSCQQTSMYIEQNSALIGNGISDNWLADIELSTPEKELKLLYFGEYSQNKNVDSIIAALNVLNERGVSSRLTLIGEYGNACDEILKMVSQNDKASSLPKISDEKALIREVDKHDIFIMPSKTETFGVAYIEAMARGIPVVYSKGQGIDGYFEKNTVGCAVEATDSDAIAQSVELISKNYLEFSKNATIASKKFSWSSIVKSYINIIRKI